MNKILNKVLICHYAWNSTLKTTFKYKAQGSILIQFTMCTLYSILRKIHIINPNGIIKIRLSLTSNSQDLLVSQDMEFNLLLINLKGIQEDGLLLLQFQSTQIFLKKILIRMEIWKLMNNAKSSQIETHLSISSFLIESLLIQFKLFSKKVGKKTINKKIKICYS